VSAEAPPRPGEHDPGDHLLAELKWVHGHIRHDLAVCRELAEEVAAGAAPAAVEQRIAELKTAGPLWQLRANCLQYCRFVHLHHRLEDVRIFPAIRASDPALGPTVDRLESDHRQVGDRLDEIEAAVEALGERDDADSRRRVAAALGALSDLLLEHLAFEEEALAPVLRGWPAWPV
jgi:hypothetical protein